MKKEIEGQNLDKLKILEHESRGEFTYETKDNDNIRFKSHFTGNNHLPGSNYLWNERISAGSTNNWLDGEFANVERTFSNVNLFEFYGNSNKIDSANDVAYMFRQLEKESVEHAFAVFVDNEKNYQVQWLGMGGIASAIVDTRVLVQGAKVFNAKEIYFVHNHPSGNLKPSSADFKVLSSLEDAFSHFNISVNGLIINLNSGKYITFNASHENDIEQSYGKDLTPIDVLAFNRQLFLAPPSQTFITSSRDVAAFVSQQKFSIAPKTGYLIANQASEITANFFATKDQANEMIAEMAGLVTQYGGTSIFLYTNSKDEDDKYKFIRKGLKDFNILLLDVIQVQSSDYVLHTYRSLGDEGLISEAQNNYLIEHNPTLVNESSNFFYRSPNKKNKTQADNKNQLSLFDSFTDEKNIESLNNVSSQWSDDFINNIKKYEDVTNNNIRGQQSDDGQQRGSDLHERSGKLESQTALSTNEGTATGKIQVDEGKRDVDSIPERIDMAVLHNGEESIGGWNVDSSSRGSILAELGTERRVVNFHNDSSFYSFASFGKQRHLKDNIAVLKLLASLDEEKRPADKSEQTVLAKYVGWGGLKEILLNPTNDNEWKTNSDISLRTLIGEVYESFNKIDPDGKLGVLKAAQRSILSAYYTPFPVINSIYDGLKKAGFESGRILEPSAGIGNFLSAMPGDMANRSEVTAVEMDIITGKILQHLFPSAETKIAPLEKTRLPENSFDLVLSNVPFADVTVYDTQLENLRDKKFAKASTNLHNYFFAKAITLTRPGGLIAFVTSRYTMDSTESPEIRDLIKDSCEFLGAIRLPDNTFKANAGTEVVADMIFLKKNENGERQIQKHLFQDVTSIPFTDASGKNGIISYNEYFHNNPGHMLGTVEFGGLFNQDGFNLKGDTSVDIGQAISNILSKIFESPIYYPRQSEIENNQANGFAVKNYISLGQYDSIGNILSLQDGLFGIIKGDGYVDLTLAQKANAAGINIRLLQEGKVGFDSQKWMDENGISISDFNLKVVQPVKVSKADAPKLPLIEQIRKLTKEVIYREADGWSGPLLENKREQLKDSYFKFVSKHGNLLAKDNEKALALDTDGILIQSLERKDNTTQKIVPSDILFYQTIKPYNEITHTDNVTDAIMLSLQKKGVLDMHLVCELMDKPYNEIMAAQIGDKAEIFIDSSGKHVAREDFLSGNILEKINEEQKRRNELIELNASSQEISLVENNIKQLEHILPKPIHAIDIYAPLHARWIPKQDISNFISELFQTSNFDLAFSRSMDEYQLNGISENAHSDAFKTQRRTAKWVLTHALNGVEPIVNFTDSEGKQIFDGQDTHIAKENYKKIRTAWDDWKYKDPERRERLAQIYNEKFNNTVLRKFETGNYQFLGLLGFVPLKHQTSAVFRNVQTMGGINDHIVGAGKTLVQVMTAMELRRLRTANKPLIIGLKSQVPQLYEQFKKAYPLSKVLFPTEKDFTKENRQRLLNNMATNDWDCIILSHDQFNAIPQPLAIQENLMKELADGLRQEISDMDGSDKQIKKALQSRLYNYEQKLERLNDSKKDFNVLDFSKLGIDFLMVDESQEYKNLEFSTRKRNIRGLGNPIGSKKAFNLLVACRHLQSLHGGDKGILFCSGTPISNSMAELYLLFKYLRPNKLKENGLETFDRWASNFANDYSDLEYYMGKFKEVHRFREFANLPELITMYREIADVRNDSNLVLDKPKAAHNLMKIAPSENQLNYIKMLQDYIESKGNNNKEVLGLTAGYDRDKGINPSFAILAINFAKKLSLDPRLINPLQEAGSKILSAADNIAKTYFDTNEFKGTQLMFCDIGTPKGTNVLDNLHSYLEGETSQSDLHEIFGGDYHEMSKKPLFESVKTNLAAVLQIDPKEVDNLVLEANAKENFSVYDELKNTLIERNVPASQIAFIHDYKTRNQKDVLYAAFNKGEIRIVFGSTKKLGTGVNVQERLAALHHLDISWRPSDMEQRNGRGERQGNWAAKNHLGNKINCFYYATERTLDASMYNTVSLKSKFIAQIKTTSDISVRSIKDIEEDVDMGGMAAELSGDPIFKEKAALQKSVVDLEQSNKGYLQNKYNIQDRLKRSHLLLDHYHKKVEGLEKAIPLLDKIPKNELGEEILRGVVNNTFYQKVGEFGRAMLEEAEYAKKHFMVGKKIKLGSLWGFQVVGEMLSGYDKSFSRQVISPLGDKIGLDKELPSGEMAMALQVRETILNMPSELERVNKAIVATDENVIEYEKQLAVINPYEKKLIDCKSRLEVVNEIIKERTKVEVTTKEENKKLIGSKVSM